MVKGSRLYNRNSLKIFRKKRNSFNLRMTPMIDVVFLLLIFFLVAANWKAEESYLPLKLSSAKADTELIEIEPLQIKLSQQNNKCRLHLSSKTITLEQANLTSDIAEFQRRLKNIMDKQKRSSSDPVELICNDGVKWNYIARIYDVLYGMQITDVTFAVGSE